MSERKGLRGRIRNVLQDLGIGARPKPPGLGAGFGAANEEEWNELVEQVDNYTQKVGAAVVQTWEVGAAELGRVLQGLPEEKTLIERYSDALVPTLTPFQDLHKLCSGAMSRGFAAGVERNSIAAATSPLAQMVDGLGGRAQEGWTKTVAYLEPIVAVSADPAATRARLLAAGEDLARGCLAAEGVLRAQLQGAAERPRLWDAV